MWLTKTRALVAAAGASLLLVALTAYGLDQTQAEPLKIYFDAPSFNLIDHLERPVSSDEFQGKVVVANFIYTNCKDICPLLSIRMQALQERLREEGLLGSHVQLLSFTVDPARDTTDVLRTYAERHRADPSAWRFLTGPEEEVKTLVSEGFHLGRQALPAQTPTPGGHAAGASAHAEYEVMHSGRFVLIDPQERIRAYYDGRELDIDRVVREIRQLLR